MNRIATIVKGYPRLSETFIAQEILGLEKRGVAQLIVSLRHPTEGKVQDLNREIKAEVLYLPEYLQDDPARVRAARQWAEAQPGYASALKGVPRRPEARPLGQPPPALRSGLRAGARASRRRRLDPHALPPHAGFGRALRRADPRHGLVVLGARQGHLDDAGMGAARTSLRTPRGASPARAPTSTICARSPPSRRKSISSITGWISRAFLRRRSARPSRAAPFTIVSVGRAVEKKGYADLLRALAQLGGSRDWRFEHAGGGALGKAPEGAGGEARHRRSNRLARRAGPRLHLRHARSAPTSSCCRRGWRAPATATDCRTC